WNGLQEKRAIASLTPSPCLLPEAHPGRREEVLSGCWLDRVLDYPLTAWEREGGDGKEGSRTQRIEAFLKGEQVGNRWSGDGRSRREIRASDPSSPLAALHQMQSRKRQFLNHYPGSAVSRRTERMPTSSCGTSW